MGDPEGDPTGVTDPVSAGGDRFRGVWWVFGLALAAMLVWFAWQYVGTFAFAVFLYYVGRPISRRIEPLVGSEARAATLTIALVVLPFVVILVLVVLIALAQLLSLTQTDVAQFVELLAPVVDLETLSGTPRELLAMLAEEGLLDARLVFDSVLEALTASVRLTFHVTLVFAVVFLLLRDDVRLARWVQANVAAE